jgi:NTE family protein
MTSIGLVLGAGGVLGGAYHAGALAALAEATGWDPRSADLIVGTSAGANTAAALRGGLAAPDHLARATDQPPSPEGADLTSAFPHRIRLPEPEGMAPWPPWNNVPQAPWLVGPAFLRPGRARWGVAVAGLLPAGRQPTTVIGERVTALHADRWPDPPTWIVSYRTRDARRVVFGRDDIDVPDLATAVEASSAVPGRFRPVQIGSDRYIDGAVFSPSNVDVVAGLAFDLVVVCSPMTSMPGALPAGNSLAARGRAWCTGLLADEVTAVSAKGTPVLVLEPGVDDLTVMRGTGTAHDRSPDVARSAYRSVLERLDDPDASTAVGILSRTS